LGSKRNNNNGRNKRRPAAKPGDEVKRYFVGIWHQLRLMLPTPANAMRHFAENYTFLYRSAGAAIAGVPPVVLTSYYQVATFSEEFRKDWPALATLLDKHVLIGCVLGGVWVYLVMSLRRFLASFADTAPPGWDTAPSTILKAIDNVVGAKQQRFSDFLRKMGNTSPAPSTGEIFSTITQPTQQISELVKGVYSTFDILLRGTLPSKRYALKVNLAVINGDGKVVFIQYHYPSNHPVRSPIDALNNQNSTIRCAVTAKKPIVIESILAEAAKANPRFAVTDPAYSQEDGSLICYPVLLEGIDSVVFVLSVFVDVPGAFKPKHHDAFNQVIEPFALRLKLEYALLAMKEESPS
jgi:hypothetical protein